LSIITQNKRRRVRLVDIAERANVSPIAVSQVLNPRPSSARVSEATAKRVMEIARQMNYRPNLAARQLAGQRSMLIGAIIDSYSSMTAAESLVTMERYATEHGFRFLVGYIHDDYDQIKHYTDDFLSRDVEGVVCLAHTYPEFGHKVPELFKPFRNCVFIEPPLDGSAISYASLNYEHMGYIATKHLIEHGRQRIGVMFSQFNSFSVAARMQGYRRALSEAGLPFDDELAAGIDLSMVNTFEASEEAVEVVLPRNPDALIASSDEVAMWLIKSLRLHKINAPSDIAIVSTEHWTLGDAFSPSITSMELRGKDVAMEAIRMLIDDIKRPKDLPRAVRSSVLEPRLHIGESCGCTPNR